MKTKLKQIRSMARASTDEVFTSVFHLVVNVDHLRSCYHALKGRKAMGVDKQTKEEYGENLEANLEDLCNRLHRGGYRPKPARRTWIEKASGPEKRPLAVSCFEDKIVQRALCDLLDAVFEPCFLNESYGYREGRSPHQCLDELGRHIQKSKTNCVLEADIRKFFDRMNHEHLLKFVNHRIKDSRVTRLLTRLLRSGIIEEGLCSPNEVGAPQGSILSPMLSNIYLHYVLDLWFTVRVSKKLKGEGRLFRFADDFVICFQYKSEAGEVMRGLKKRLEQFKLELAEEKTSIVSYGRFERSTAQQDGRKCGSFIFLSFRFVCGETRDGHFKVKRWTSKKRLSASFREMQKWLKANYARLRKGALIRAVIRKVTGHLNYFGITDNARACSSFMHFVRRMLRKALNRKSQRKSYRTWADFDEALKFNRWPSVCIKHKICPCRKVMEQGVFEGMG